jgi:hypothetical protein
VLFAGATWSDWSYNLPVRLVKHISVSLFALLLASSAAAQMRNPPPASIYSVGGTTLGGPPASIYSLPSRPVGVGRTCCAAGINFGAGHNFGGGHHQGRGGHRGAGGVIGYPVYYPVYPYDSYTGVEQPAESIPGAGTFDRPRYTEDTSPAAAREPEPRPRSDRPDDSRYGEHYLDSRAAQPPAPVAPPPEPSETPTTLLIFRDGHRLEVRNYAIMGSTLFIITPDRRKIPLADLDLQATGRENDDRGVDFRVPSSTE